MIKSPDNTIIYRSADGYREVMEHYERTFRALRVPTEPIFVNTSFGLTHVVTCGNENGKPLVLWHGQNANAASWANWIPSLAPTYRIYAVDVIGGMGKSAPNRPSKKGMGFGQWAAELLNGMKLANANMIGASQGGWIIMKLGNVAPEMISSAVLMSSAGFLPLSIIQTLRMIPRILFKSQANAARATYDLVSAPGVPPDLFFIELFELMLRYFRSEAIVPVLSDTELEGFKAPTYLLVGQYERTMNPFKLLERGLKLLPSVILAEVVPGVGHSMIHSDPDWVISRVMNFLHIYAV